jgi:hypothetical protein
VAFGSIPAAHYPVPYDAETPLQAASSTQLVNRARGSVVEEASLSGLGWLRGAVTSLDPALLLAESLRKNFALVSARHLTY